MNPKVPVPTHKFPVDQSFTLAAWNKFKQTIPPVPLVYYWRYMPFVELSEEDIQGRGS